MSGSAFPMAAPGKVYRERRAKLAKQLRRPLVLFAGHGQARNYANNMYPFRAGSTYLYFGGVPIEHAVLIIEPGSDGDEGCTFLRTALTHDDIVWMGPMPGDDAIAEATGLSRARINDIERLADNIPGTMPAAIVPPCPQTIATAQRVGLEAASDDELRIIVDMRLCKDEHELAAMRRAAAVSIEAHRAAMANTKPGRREADVAAAFAQVMVAHQCSHSFSPIITIHGEILHAHGHPHPLEAGQLLVADAGVQEPCGYASDITRTYPVNGKWTDIQRVLYTTVVRANRETTAQSKPGVRYRELHDLAGRIICEGLVEAGLLKGNPAELAERRAHTLFFTHGLGHLLGLDVHDMEDFDDLAGYAPGRTRRPAFGDKFLRLDRDLAPGIAFTIEPGLYIVPAIWQSAEMVAPFADVVVREKIDALVEGHFGGIRVENTIVVRDSGAPEVLGAELPMDPDDVAQCVGTAN